MTRFALPLLLALGACSDAPEVEGIVQDIWGNALSEATVRMEGTADLTATTDGAGQFKFELPESSDRAEAGGPMRFRAEKEGYLPGTVKVLVSEDPEAEAAPVVLKLYKDPGAVGFYAIGDKEYLALQQTPLKTTGSELGAYTGLSADPGVSLAGSQEFLFSSTASRSELSRLNLQLHRLEFKESASVVGATGATDVRVNLWLAEGQPIPFDLTVLEDNFYLLKPRESLSPGNYAFHTQGMLATTDPAVLNNSPRELQVAYPFTVK